MTTTTRRLVLISVILILLCAAGVFALRFFFSRERILAWVTPPLEHYLQRQVQIGDASLALRGLRLVNLDVREKGAPTPLLTSERVDLHWNLLSLVKARLEIGALVFDKPALIVSHEKDGTFSIRDLLLHCLPSDKAAEGARAVSRDLAFGISAVSMKHGRITLVDRALSPAKTTTLAGVSARISGFVGPDPVSFRSEGQLDGETTGSFRVEGTFEPGNNLVQARFELRSLDLGSLSPYLTFKSASLSKGKMVLSAALKVEGLDRLDTKGTMQLTDLQVKIGQESLPSMNLEAAFDVNGVHSQHLLNISALQLVVNGQRCDARGRLSRRQQRPYVEFSLSSPSLKLDQLLELLPGPEASARARESLAATPGARTDAPSSGLLSQLKLDDFKALLPGDQSSPKDTAGAPAGALDSQPPRGSGKSTEPEPSATPGPRGKHGEPSGEPFWHWRAAVPLLLQVDAVGNVELEWLYYRKFVANKVTCQVRLQSGSLRVEPLRASLWGGQLDVSLHRNLHAPGWPFETRCSLKNVMVDEFARALMPAAVGRLSGNLTLASVASGSSPELTHIQSRGDVVMTEAEFTGYPVIQEVAEIFRADELKRLQFAKVSAQVLTNRGIATIADLRMEGSTLQVEGNGSVSLGDGNLDLRLLLRLPVQYAGKVSALGPFLSQLTDKEDFTRVPLQLSGTAEKPECRLDHQWLKQRFKEAALERGQGKEQEPPELPPSNDQKQ